MRHRAEENSELPAYLQEHVGAIFTGILNSVDVLARHDSPRQSTFWTRSEADALALHRVVTAALGAMKDHAWRDQIQAEVVRGVPGTVEQGDETVPETWGVSVRWSRPGS